jgi:hypothetical protein
MVFTAKHQVPQIQCEQEALDQAYCEAGPGLLAFSYSTNIYEISAAAYLIYPIPRGKASNTSEHTFCQQRT